MRNLYLLMGALATGMLSSCIDDSYDLDNFSEDVYLPIQQVVPVGSSVVTIKDLLRELEVDGLSEEADGLVYFQYDTISSFYINSFDFDMDRDTSQLLLSDIFPTGVPLRDVNIKQDIPLKVSLPIVISGESGEGRLDSADLRKLSIDFEVVTNVPGLLSVVNIESKMPSNLQAQVKSPFLWDRDNKKGRFVLENVWLDLTDSDTLWFDCLIKLDGTLPLSLIEEDSYIGVVSKATDIQYNKLYGYFVARTEQTDLSTMSIDVCAQEGMDYSLSLVDPRVEINVWTNSGVPVNVGVESLVARSIAGHREAAKYSDGSNRYTLTMAPSLVEGEEILGMHEIFDRKNGSIDRLINSAPDSVDVETSFFVNGKEGASDKSYFLLDSTYIRLGVSAVIPIWMNAGSYIVYNDTIKDVDIYQDIIDYEKEDYELEHATVYLEVENGLPLNAEVEFVFLREDSVRAADGWRKIYSEIDNEYFKQSIKLDAATLNADSHSVLKATSNRIEIAADKEILDDLKQLKHIAVRYKVQVPIASASAKVYAQNLIKAKAYVKVKGNYSHEDNN